MPSLTELTMSPDKVPPGWLTMRQWAAREGLSREAVTRRINKLTEIGKVKMRRFRIDTGQVVRPVPHYKVEGVK